MSTNDPVGSSPIHNEVKATGTPIVITIKRAWGKPLAKLDGWWTRTEAALCAGVLIAEIIALCAWISLKGLSAEFQNGDISGVIFRSVLAAVVLGIVTHVVTKPKNDADEGLETKAGKRHALAVSTSVVLGLVAGRVWPNVGVSYFSNLLNWMQNASLLMLVGGLRGVATRLTLWLALIGASIATSKGKHINVDVVMRFLPVKARVPVAVLGWMSAAVMSLAGVWGFFDHIAIESFKAPAMHACADDPTKSCDVAPAEKFAHVADDIKRDIFLTGRQISLDVKSIPLVLKGERYDQYMKTGDWNAWMKSANWTAHYSADDVQGQMMPEDQPDQTRLPAVNVPGGAESARGLLIRDLNFVFPFGLLMIAMRFILRSLLAISGHVRVDPDAAHGEDDVHDAHGEQDALIESASGDAIKVANEKKGNA